MWILVREDHIPVQVQPIESGQYILTSGWVSPSLLGMFLTGCLTGIWLFFSFGGNSFNKNEGALNQSLIWLLWCSIESTASFSSPVSNQCPSLWMTHCLLIKLCACFMFMWPCITTNFCIIKPNRCTNFTNLFCHETPHVSDSLPVHRQEFIHCSLSNGICHTGL